MFFLQFTLIPLAIGAIISFLILRKHMDMKLLAFTAIIAYGIVYILTTPILQSWYFTNLPFPITYLTTIVIYSSMLYSLAALILILIDLFKRFVISPKISA